jgi:hypothetical protein
MPPQRQSDERQFVCRIQARTTETVIRENAVTPGGIIFYDAVVLGINQTEKELRAVGYRVDGKDYWIATNRHDLSGEDVAQVYKLRWNIETFFGWWKRHLEVCHLTARSPYGLMIQILGGLITCLLLAIYCREQHGEKVRINRGRELRMRFTENLNKSQPAPALTGWAADAEPSPSGQTNRSFYLGLAGQAYRELPSIRMEA